MGQYLQWYPPDQAVINHANLYDGDPGTWYWVNHTLGEYEQYDTWPFYLTASNVYSFSAFNSGGFSGLWTDIILADASGNALRWSDFFAEEIGDYNADIWNFSPTYSGTHYLIVYKHFTWDKGFYQVNVTDVAKYVPPPDPNAPVYLTGTAGADNAVLTAKNESYLAQSGDDTVLGMDGNDSIWGDAGNDDINGNAGVDWVQGSMGRDFVRGGQGDDWVAGDFLFSPSSPDGDSDWHLNGNAGNDVVYGGAGNDGLFGGPDFDRLYGGLGNDTLSGDLGNDSLYGEEGADRYDFRSGSGQDTVYGFDGGQGDRIHIAVNVNGTGITSFQDLVSRLSQQAGGIRLDLGAGNTVFFVGLPANHIWSGVVEFG